MIWTETAEEMYLRHAMKVRRDRLTEAGWEIDIEDEANSGVWLLVEDPDGDAFRIRYHSAEQILRRLWELEWDYVAKPPRPKREQPQSVFGRTTIMAPLNTEVFAHYQNIFAG